MLIASENCSSSASKKIALGIYGEKLIATYLKKNGYSILKQNYRIRGGEVDIIAQQNNTIIFVEVKTRRNSYFNLSQVIVPAKQQAIIRTAEHFLLMHHIKNCVIRFDLALIDNLNNVTYIPNAFTKSSKI
ncbi:MAG: YraN family protein [Candidatus Babeliales bacterium]